MLDFTIKKTSCWKHIGEFLGFAVGLFIFTTMFTLILRWTGALSPFFDIPSAIVFVLSLFCLYRLLKWKLK